ncbi:MAG: glycosyltransferase family 39 protein [Candidatus Omnitrophota bacterium]|nr:glycosyltransferase family 39 protein [Candidatus Omnitrophota bacterium]
MILFLITVLSLARFIYLGSVPGLHGDEALYGIKTFFMMHKPLTLIGFNYYTGPLISYLRIPFYHIMGINVFSLRLPVVVLSLLTIFFAYKVLEKLYGRETGIIAAFLFLTIPWFFIESRFADETHMTLPFFAICGLYYLLKDRKLKTRALAGVFLGLGVFNHIIFIIVLASYAMYFLIKNRFRIILNKGNILFLAIVSGFFLIRLSLIYSAHVFNPAGSGWYYTLEQVFNKDFIYKIFSGIPYFLDMMNGGIFYKRMTGDILINPAPVNSALFMASLLFLAVRYRWLPEYKAGDTMLISLFALNCMINLVFLMKFSMRYFVVTLMFGTMLMAVFIGAWGVKKWVKIMIVSMIVALNSFYLGYDYMYSFKKSGGRAAYFRAGNFIENSADFTDPRALYDYLKKKGAVCVWLPEWFLFPKWQLMFLDINEKKLNIVTKKEGMPPGTIYFVCYKGGKGPESYGLKSGYTVLKEDSGLVNFDIYKLEK